MPQHIALITYLVRDYDEAITWFRDALGFELREDSDQGQGKRWVVMAPAGESGARFLLAKAVTEQQVSAIGKAAGGRVAFFLHSTDFATLHGKMISAGVRFLESPRHETYGTVAVFEDLYGNRWDLIQPA
ncbi:VOC family protein [Aestuariivirga litoralis]|uniref:VOC family protein n=1 Tax=Aestuariivirga litoralis TaxID=2650924 RepID=UPI0018C803E1|nr:VOC family protein [Aestuariivirga litoralis]MBG1232463.1 VOC family protein [Aestuariivirga litoralis]